MPSSCIQVKNLTKLYGDLTAVDDISFDVHSGEILGILGPNGSGKTSTLKSILGLILFEKGSISVDGLSVRTHRQEILKNIGAVLEGARNIYWYLTPMENLIYFAGIRGLAGKAVLARAHSLLKSLNLLDVADKEVRQFSAGMKQKCALACAFIHDPSILLLDEPTLGLDVETRGIIEQWLVNTVTDEGKTILVTSHDMHFIESICKRILIIRRGKIVSHETVDSLKQKFSGKHFILELDREPDSSLLEALYPLGTVTAWGNSLKIELKNINNLISIMRILGQSGAELRDCRNVEKNLETIFLEVLREKS